MTCSSFSTAACRLLMLVLTLALPTLPRTGRIGESSIASEAWAFISLCQSSCYQGRHICNSFLYSFILHCMLDSMFFRTHAMIESQDTQADRVSA